MNSFVFALLISSAAVSAQNCKTTSGQDCVFSFNYREMSFNKCTKADYGTYWCATSVDSDGNFLTFGDCEDSCPKVVHDPASECLTTGNIPCSFPFHYKDGTYNKCTTKDNNGVAWCAINTYPGSEEAYHFESCNIDSQCPN